MDIEQGGITDMTAADVWDLLTTKYWAIKLATGAACTVLWVDRSSWRSKQVGQRAGQQMVEMRILVQGKANACISLLYFSLGLVGSPLKESITRLEGDESPASQFWFGLLPTFLEF